MTMILFTLVLVSLAICWIAGRIKRGWVILAAIVAMYIVGNMVTMPLGKAAKLSGVRNAQIVGNAQMHSSWAAASATYSTRTLRFRGSTASVRQMAHEYAHLSHANRALRGAGLHELHSELAGVEASWKVGIPSIPNVWYAFGSYMASAVDAQGYHGRAGVCMMWIMHVVLVLVQLAFFKSGQVYRGMAARRRNKTRAVYRHVAHQ